MQLVTSPEPATTAYAMFAVVRDSTICIAGISQVTRWSRKRRSRASRRRSRICSTIAAAHQFLRIRKVSNAATGTEDVVFESAPNSGGVPGTFTERYHDVWDPRLSAIVAQVRVEGGNVRAGSLARVRLLGQLPRGCQLQVISGL